MKGERAASCVHPPHILCLWLFCFSGFLSHQQQHVCLDLWFHWTLPLDPPTSASGKLNIGAEGSRTWCKRGDFTACAAHVVIVTSHTSTVSRSCSLVNWISSEPHGAPGVFVIVERWRRCSERQFIGSLWFQYWSSCSRGVLREGAVHISWQHQSDIW